MILDVTGQTYQFEGKVFAVGGAVLELTHGIPRPLGTILEIRVEDGEDPVAQCGYEDFGPECCPLAKLEPVSPVTPPETERQYALFFYFDGSDGQQVDVLGVSSDRGVLIRKMLDDVEGDPFISAILVSQWENSEEKTLNFTYESADERDPFCLDYVIKPVPVYPRYEGGMST